MQQGFRLCRRLAILMTGACSGNRAPEPPIGWKPQYKTSIADERKGQIHQSGAVWLSSPPNCTIRTSAPRSARDRDQRPVKISGYARLTREEPKFLPLHCPPSQPFTKSSFPGGVS